LKGVYEELYKKGTNNQKNGKDKQNDDFDIEKIAHLSQTLLQEELIFQRRNFIMIFIMKKVMSYYMRV
jgi:hypothetical protein